MVSPRRNKSKSHQLPEAKPADGQEHLSVHPIALLVVLTIIAASIVLIAHWPALSAKAISFDDDQYLFSNPLVKNPSFSSAARFLSEVSHPSTVAGYYQPLTMISMMLDYACGGRPDSLLPFHRTSLVLHVCNTSLIIVLLYMLFGQPWAAAMAGLLFGVHPMTVETIPWLGERKTLLAAFFSLWCLILYVRYTRTSSWKSYTGCLVMCVLALMSKPTSTPLPVLLLMLDCWPLRRLNRRAIVEKIPFFVFAGVFAGITLISQGHTVELTIERAQYKMALPLTICHNLVFYPYKMLWPAVLSSVYPFPEPMTLANPVLLSCVIIICVLIVALIISLRWTRAFMTGWLFFTVAISPTLMVAGYSLGIAADKYVYLPSIGLLLTLTWLVSHFWSGPSWFYHLAVRRGTILLMVCIPAVFLARTTRHQYGYWHDSESLYRHMLSAAPQSAPVLNGLGLALSERDQPTEAVEHLTKALEINPRFDHAHYNLANALYKLGRADEAFKHYSLTVQVNPNYYKAYNNLGSILLTQGKNDDAIVYITEALRLNQDYPEAHTNMGIALARRGEIDKAIQHYNKAIQIKPDYFQAHYNLANALAKKGIIDEAVKHYRRSLEINPGSTNARAALMELTGQKIP